MNTQKEPNLYIGRINPVSKLNQAKYMSKDTILWNKKEMKKGKFQSLQNNLWPTLTMVTDDGEEITDCLDNFHIMEAIFFKD